jgi:CDP-diacylglycerol--serine O-phosphatidyltransferase
MSSIPKLLKLKDYITLTGTTMSLIALVCALIGDRFFLSWGFFLVVCTIGTDMLDGLVARKTGTVNEIGKELDSLNDSLAFGVVPAILTIQTFKTGTLYDILLVIGAICFALGALLRLARFNISTDTPGYTGVPTPLSALLMIVFFYANYFIAFAFGGGGSAGIVEPFPIICYYAVPFIMIFIGWMNITTIIKFGEKGKAVYRFFMILAGLTVVLGIIGITPLSNIFGVSLAVSIFFFGSFITEMGYLVIGSFILSEDKKEKVEKSE